jgi:hypothetical protein
MSDCKLPPSPGPKPLRDTGFFELYCVPGNARGTVGRLPLRQAFTIKRGYAGYTRRRGLSAPAGISQEKFPALQGNRSGGNFRRNTGHAPEAPSCADARARSIRRDFHCGSATAEPVSVSVCAGSSRPGRTVPLNVSVYCPRPSGGEMARPVQAVSTHMNDRPMLAT